MCGAWAEKRIGQTRLVLSGRFEIEGVSYFRLSFHHAFSLDDALIKARSSLSTMIAAKARPRKTIPKKPKFDFLESNEEYGDGFPASLMDGPSVDLFVVAGFEWTSELNDAVWGNYNWKSLLEECETVEIIETGSQDHTPAMSDVFYWVAITDPKKFKQELRAAMLAASRKG